MRIVVNSAPTIPLVDLRCRLGQQIEVSTVNNERLVLALKKSTISMDGERIDVAGIIVEGEGMRNARFTGWINAVGGGILDAVPSESPCTAAVS